MTHAIEALKNVFVNSTKKITEHSMFDYFNHQPDMGQKIPAHQIDDKPPVKLDKKKFHALTKITHKRNWLGRLINRLFGYRDIKSINRSLDSIMVGHTIKKIIQANKSANDRKTLIDSLSSKQHSIPIKHTSNSMNILNACFDIEILDDSKYQTNQVIAATGTKLAVICEYSSIKNNDISDEIPYTIRIAKIINNEIDLHDSVVIDVTQSNQDMLLSIAQKVIIAECIDLERHFTSVKNTNFTTACSKKNDHKEILQQIINEIAAHEIAAHEHAIHKNLSEENQQILHTIINIQKNTATISNEQLTFIELAQFGECTINDKPLNDLVLLEDKPPTPSKYSFYFTRTGDKVYDKRYNNNYKYKTVNNYTTGTDILNSIEKCMQDIANLIAKESMSNNDTITLRGDSRGAVAAIIACHKIKLKYPKISINLLLDDECKGPNFLRTFANTEIKEAYLLANTIPNNVKHVTILYSSRTMPNRVGNAIPSIFDPTFIKLESAKTKVNIVLVDNYHTDSTFYGYALGDCEKRYARRQYQKNINYTSSLAELFFNYSYAGTSYGINFEYILLGYPHANWANLIKRKILRSSFTDCIKYFSIMNECRQQIIDEKSANDNELFNEAYNLLLNEISIQNLLNHKAFKDLLDLFNRLDKKQLQNISSDDKAALNKFLLQANTSNAEEALLVQIIKFNFNDIQTIVKFNDIVPPKIKQSETKISDTKKRKILHKNLSVLNNNSFLEYLKDCFAEFRFNLQQQKQQFISISDCFNASFISTDKEYCEVWINSARTLLDRLDKAKKYYLEHHYLGVADEINIISADISSAIEFF